MIVFGYYAFRRIRENRWDLVDFRELRKGDIFEPAAGSENDRGNLLIALEDAHKFSNSTNWGVPCGYARVPSTHTLTLSAKEAKFFDRIAS